MMRELLVFVEGETEQLAFSRAFGFKPEIIGIASDHVAPERIAKFVAARFIRKGGAKRLVVIFDRETRIVESEHIESSVRLVIEREVCLAGMNTAVSVSVCDRMFESWLFSDTEETGKYFKRTISDRHSFEGRNAVEFLKSLIGTGRYNKTFDGPRLFERITWSVVERRSVSAKRANMKSFLPDCEWTSR